MDSTTSAPNAPAVAAGGSAFGDPSGGGKAHGVPGGTGDADGYAPVSEVDVSTMPDVDADACGKAATYPPEAERDGVEGDVRLRVALDASGHVHNVRVLRGLGHGLDQAAMETLKHKCRFKPAIDRGGKPVAFVIESYTFHFELPR
jgi:protein TonB